MSSAVSRAVAKKKILVVEDHPLFRAMLVRLINQELGLMVCGQADNIRDALTLIKQTRPDAAIVDLTLAGSNGLGLLKDLTARNLRLPVLVLSMHAKKLYAERVLRAAQWVAERRLQLQVPACQSIQMTSTG